VYDERRAIFAKCVNRGGQRSRGVDNHDVAVVEKLRKVMRMRMHDAQIVLVRHQHAHCVTSDATRFGRFGGLAHGDRGGHRDTTSKSVAR
jgi:hypothetical protein